MPQINLDPPLIAKDGTTLKVVAIDRISTKNQDPKSNADQRALLDRWVKDRYDGKIEWTHITGQGSGECIDREQVRAAEDAVLAGDKDLVIMEDLGRHLRRVQAIGFCEECEDHDTRLVAINDSIDTLKDWRLHAFFAAIKHEQSNKDTSERIKRTQKNRFQNGEMVQFIIAGYIKPNGAKTDSELQKDPSAQPVYDKWFEMLENGATYSDIADWLNSIQFATGPFCRSDAWDCKMVARTTHNPILKGVRQRNNRKSKRVNNSGKYKSIKARPEEKLERNCPHLAFIEPARYDRVLQMLKERNSHYKPGGVDGRDPRIGRPKKRTIWPGQHMYCGICGGLYRYGGHGQNDHLLCRGACEYRCWNAITVDGPLAAKKLSAGIFAAIEALPDFEPVFQQLILRELEASNCSRTKRLDDLHRRKAEIGRQLANVMDFIREGKRTKTLHDEVDRLEADLDSLACQQTKIEKEPTNGDLLPSMDELKQLARGLMARQADEPYEFGRIMRSLIPKIVVLPYRSCDGGAIVLRARFQLSLVPLLPPSQHLVSLERVLHRDLSVDLFEPAQRVEFRERVMKLRAHGKTEAQVALELGITTTAAQRAAALDRLMTQLGLIDPYVPVTEPPGDYSKLRRHLHARYRFEPLSDAGQF